MHAIVQARMSSSRLPGKVLREEGGKQLLGYLLERVGRCSCLGGVVVATSTEAADDPVARYCAEQGVPCCRGPLEDVAGRFVRVLERYPEEAFVRLTADSPLLDPALVERAAALFEEG